MSLQEIPGHYVVSIPGSVDSATCSAIASAYAESAASSKQDTLTFGYNISDQISSINGSALGGMDEAAVSGIASAYAESAVSAASSNYYPSTSNPSGYLTAQAQASWSESASASPSYIQDKPDLVDIVAGPGIHIDNPDGNTLRVSVAQDVNTVLWTGSMWDGSSMSANLAEPASNFEYVMIYGYAHEASARGCAQVFPVSGSSYVSLNCGNLWYSDYLCYNANSTVLNLSGHNHAWLNGSTVNAGTDGLVITKIVGCARTASAQ